jgi:hypothetical protein
VARRGGDPLVALALFGQRSFAVGLVLVVCVYSVLSSYYLALSVSVQDGLGLSAVVVIPTLVVQSAGGGLLITPLLNVVLSRVVFLLPRGSTADRR